jgi:tetratricopeptide (TPR) repeat protein
MDYDYPISYSFLEWNVIFGLMSLAGILVAGVLLFRKYRLISFGIFWFFLTMSVESSIIPISQNVIFEHRTYLPGLGFFLVLTGVVFYFLWDRYRQIASGILLLLVLTSAVLTYERNKVWASEYTLWADCLKKSPNKPRPLCNYGKALADAGNASEALTYYDKAINLNHRFYAAYYNRGNAKVKLGDYEGAVHDYEETLRINPSFSDAYYNLGNALAHQGNMAKAVAQLEGAVRLRPRSAEYQNNLGYVLALQGKEEEAMTHFREAIRLKPDLADAHNNLGNALFHQGRLEEAVASYREALRINPGFNLARDNLKRALVKHQ